MNIPDAAELVLVVFSRMSKEQRTALRVLLKSVQPKMDRMYPNGIPEEPPKPASNLILPK